MNKKKHIASMQGSQVWADIQAFFREAFEELTLIDEIEVTPEQLASDLEARMKTKYDTALVLKLLENGFKNIHGIFIFKRADFFPPAAKVIGEVENA